jgi:hypothetical protein
MMKTALLISFAVTAGAVLGAGGLHVARQSQPEAAPILEPEPHAPAPSVVTRTITNVVTRVVTNAPTVNTDQLEALQWEAQELRKLLAVSNAELDKIAQEREAVEKAREARRQAWHDRDEQRRKEDPEAYAAREQQREAFREQMTQHVSDKTQFLKELDVSRMTEEELGSHNELIQRIEETWSVIEAMQQGERPNHETRDKLRENYRALNGLYAVERDYVLREVGSGLGYDTDEAVEFSNYMKEIIELTAPRSTHGMMGSRRPSSHGGGPR